MTLEHIQALKNYFTERADYFSRIDFPKLQSDFQLAKEIAVEMEELIKINMELSARCQKMEMAPTEQEAENV